VGVNELAFFGKIAAGVTHELKNVLAIINESNGLMADLLAMAKDAPFPYRDRLLRSIDRIEGQVRRGVEITGRFNRFAHGMDHESAEVDLNEAVVQTVALTQRFAMLRSLELKGLVADEPVVFITSPFGFQMALAKAVEACIDSMSGKGVINLNVRGGRGRPALDIDCQTQVEASPVFKETVSESPAWREFEEIASMLQIEIQWPRVGGTGFALIIGRDEDDRTVNGTQCSAG